MASLGSLVVSLAMDTAKFSGDVGKAAQQMARLTAEAGKIGAAIGANIGAGLRTIGELVRHSIDAADETSKLAQSLGATTEEISRLAYAADLSGASQEELGQALAKLDKQAAEAAAGGRTAGDIFAAMGVQVTGTGGALKSTTELLAEVADKFASYKDGAEKTALAQEIFGRSGARLIPLLNQGAEGLAQVGAEADKLGLALTTSAGQAAEAFNDNLTRLDKAREGLGRRIAAELLPTLQMLTDRFIGSAQSAERMARQAEIAAASVKLLISSGAILVGVFQAVGQALGGAAGLETERYDLELGTPPHTKLLASSTSWSDNYAGVVEDILFNHPGTLGTQSDTVRADMTYFTAANDGAVFATGSIAWMSALPSFDFENNVSQVMKNVLDAFQKPGSLPGGAWNQEEKSWT